MLKYRDATNNDLKKIVDIYNSTIPLKTVTADTEPVSVESRQKWFEDHNPDRRPLWVVENSSNTTIGWVSFQSFYGRPAYNATVEISIYLDTNYRSKGFGKEILQYCIDNASQFGIKTILAFIFSHNEASLKLFRNCGFQDWGVLPDIALLGDQEEGLNILGIRVSS